MSAITDFLTKARADNIPEADILRYLTEESKDPEFQEFMAGAKQEQIPESDILDYLAEPSTQTSPAEPPASITPEPPTQPADSAPVIKVTPLTSIDANGNVVPLDLPQYPFKLPEDEVTAIQVDPEIIKQEGPPRISRDPRSVEQRDRQETEQPLIQDTITPTLPENWTLGRGVETGTWSPPSNSVIGGALQAGADMPMMGLAGVAQSIASLVGAEELSDVFKNYGDLYQEDILSNTPKGMSVLQSTGHTLVTGLTAILPTLGASILAGSATPSAVMAGLNSYSSRWRSMKEAGFSDGIALINAATSASVAATTAYFGTKAHIAVANTYNWGNLTASITVNTVQGLISSATETALDIGAFKDYQPTVPEVMGRIATAVATETALSAIIDLSMGATKLSVAVVQMARGNYGDDYLNALVRMSKAIRAGVEPNADDVAKVQTMVADDIANADPVASDSKPRLPGGAQIDINEFTDVPVHDMSVDALSDVVLTKLISIHDAMEGYKQIVNPAKLSAEEMRTMRPLARTMTEITRQIQIKHKAWVDRIDAVMMDPDLSTDAAHAQLRVIYSDIQGNKVPITLLKAVVGLKGNIDGPTLTALENELIHQQVAEVVDQSVVDDGDAAFTKNMYSALEKGVAQLPFTKMKPMSLLNSIKKIPGVKEVELQFTGLSKWLKQQPQNEPVTKQRVVDFLQQNAVQTQLVTLTPDKNTPGQTDYSSHVYPGEYSNYKEQGVVWENSPNKPVRDGHYKENNVLVTMRTTDRALSSDMPATATTITQSKELVSTIKNIFKQLKKAGTNEQLLDPLVNQLQNTVQSIKTLLHSSNVPGMSPRKVQSIMDTRINDLQLSIADNTQLIASHKALRDATARVAKQLGIPQTQSEREGFQFDVFLGSHPEIKELVQPEIQAHRTAREAHNKVYEWLDGWTKQGSFKKIWDSYDSLSGGKTEDNSSHDVLIVEEIQSDWAQYDRTEPSISTVTPNPYKETSEWTLLAIKQVVDRAAREGKKGIGISTGKEQYRRSHTDFTAYYDKTIPAVLQKYIKTLDPNAAVTIKRLSGNEDIHYVPITDKIRQQVFDVGITKFSALKDTKTKFVPVESEIAAQAAKDARKEGQPIKTITDPLDKGIEGTTTPRSMTRGKNAIFADEPDATDIVYLADMPDLKGKLHNMRSMANVFQTLAKDLGMIIRPQSQVKAKGLKGQMHFKTGLITSKGGVRPDVIGHELGHKILVDVQDGTMGIKKALTTFLTEFAPKGAWGELEKLGNGLEGIAAEEGFCEYMAMWLVDRPYALKVAPETSQYMDAWLTKYPKMKAKLDAAANDLDAFRTLPENARLFMQMAVGEGSLPVASFMDRVRQLYRKHVDRFAPIRQAEREELANAKLVEQTLRDDGVDEAGIDRALTALGVRRNTDNVTPYEGVRNLQGVGGVSRYWIFKNAYDLLTMKPTGKGLKAILEPVKHQMDDFRIFLLSRHTIERYMRGKVSVFHDGIENYAALTKMVDDGITITPKDILKHAPELVKSIRTYEKNPVFTRAAQDYYDFHDNLLKTMVQTGLMDKAGYNRVKEANLYYTPFYRIFDESLLSGGTGRSTEAFKGGAKFSSKKGSTRPIIDPIESAIKNALTILTLAEKNLVMQNLVAVLGHNAKWMSKLPQIQKPVKVRWDELPHTGLLAAAEELGLMDNSDTFSIFREQAQQHNPNVLTVYNKGIPEYWWLQPELAQAVKQLDKQTVGSIASFFGKLSSPLIKGGIFTPEFALRMLMMDGFMNWAGHKAVKDPISPLIKGVSSYFKTDDLYWDYMRSGASMSTITAIDRIILQGQLDEITVHDLTGIKETMSNPLSYLTYGFKIARDLGEIAEVGPRLGAFDAMQKANLAKGMDARNAMRKAGFHSRDTMDFAKFGSQMRGMMAAVRFLGTSVNATDTMIRWMKDPEKRKTFLIRSLAGITMPSILISLATADDGRVREVNQQVRDRYWIIPTKGVSTEDWNNMDPYERAEFSAKYPIMKMTKPWLPGALFGVPVEHFIQWMADNEPKTFRETADKLLFSTGRAIGKQAMIPYMPTFPAPLMELYGNRSFFTGSNIVPESKKQTLYPEQYTSRTRNVSIKASRLIYKLQQKWFGGDVNKHPVKLSPAGIEHLIRGWFGGLGDIHLNALELAYNFPKGGLRDIRGARPGNWQDFLLVKGFMVGSNVRSRKELQEFWDTFKTQDAYTRTIRATLQRGDISAAYGYADDSISQGIVPSATAPLQTTDPRTGKPTAVSLQTVYTVITQLNGAIEKIAEDPTIKAADKKIEIGRLVELENAIASWAMPIVRKHARELKRAVKTEELL